MVYWTHSDICQPVRLLQHFSQASRGSTPTGHALDTHSRSGVRSITVGGRAERRAGPRWAASVSC